MKRKSDKSLTNKLDDLFRKVMRLKKPRTNCFVCHREVGYFAPKTEPYGLQVGHFISRSVYPLRWDLENCDFVCLSLGHSINMSDGSSKPIEDVVVGDSILGFDEDVAEISDLNIKDSMVIMTRTFSPSNNLLQIMGEDGTQIECTSDHKLLCDVGGTLLWLIPEEINTLLQLQTECNIISV